MKIAYYYPDQSNIPKDTFFCKYSNFTFMHNTCDKSVDIIYAASASILPKAIEAARIYNKRLISWCWDIPLNWEEWCTSEIDIAQNKFRDRNNINIINNLKKCDVVISASKTTQKVLHSLGVASEQLYYCIPDILIDAYTTNEKEKQIIHMSRFATSKRQEHSIYAMKNIKTHRLVLTGWGDNKKYEEIARVLDIKLSILRNMKYEGAIKQLKKSTILLSPSLHEGFGMPAIEALYCGIPVLLSNIDTYTEIYQDSVLYHKKDNKEDMREQLERLIRDTNLQHNIIKNGRKIVEQFRMKVFLSRWEKLIRSI